MVFFPFLCGFWFWLVGFFVFAESTTDLTTNSSECTWGCRGFFAMQMVVNALFYKQNPSVRKRNGGGGLSFAEDQKCLLTYGLLGGKNKRKRGGKIGKRGFGALLRQRVPACLWGELGNRSSPPHGPFSIALSLLWNWNREGKQPFYLRNKHPTSPGNSVWKRRWYLFHSVLSTAWRINRKTEQTRIRPHNIVLNKCLFGVLPVLSVYGKTYLRPWFSAPPWEPAAMLKSVACFSTSSCVISQNLRHFEWLPN